MVKFIVGIVVVIFTTYCGRYFARKYTLRKKFFEQAYSFNNDFLEELNYSKRPLGEFLAKRQYHGEFEEVLMEEIKRRNLRKMLPLSLEEYLFLTMDERRFFGDYFLHLGRGDTNAQKSYYLRAENSINSFKTKAVEECKRYIDLYTKMGFLLGLAILIILI